MKTTTILIGLFLGIASTTFAQYNSVAGKNRITENVEEEYYDKDLGEKRSRIVEKEVESDTYGNAKGNQYDLAVDGAFEGQTIAVLDFCEDGYSFDTAKGALAEKGFSVYRWSKAAPSPKELQEGLDKSCQLWIVSGRNKYLNEKHLAIIKDFFESGRGVYIWGDNDPYYVDANYIAKALIGVQMTGNTHGDQTVNLQMEEKKAGVMPNHLITTGLQNIYEGITIATLPNHKDLTPIIYGSANNLVTAVYEKDGKRLILDGGFTRLFIKWDTAGTGRYVKNAAAWLVNYERFGDDVVANQK
ncbi:MAG: hypothetical protein N4A35_01550 [Flavobacteriales bacterium]|jgi:hypothetical protein|nr:hypothetical protein [Flavobacteriales bacterium]